MAKNLLDPTTFEILYKLLESPTPLSTWDLALQKIEKLDKTRQSIDRSRFDSLFRYRLKALLKAGIVQQAFSTQACATYTIGKKAVCVNGFYLMLTNPITLIACPLAAGCQVKNKDQCPNCQELLKTAATAINQQFAVAPLI